MPIETTVADSPGWWLKRASDKLTQKRKRIDPLYARYEGNTPMPEELLLAPEPAQRFFRQSRTNFAEMLVRAVRYRLKVTGILTGDGELSDDDAFALWRTSGMNNEQHDVHRHTAVAGDGYVICAEYEGEVAATAEDPRQVITFHDPVRQSIIKAAAKFFHDDEAGVDYAYLYRPDPDDPDKGRVWVAKRPRAGTFTGSLRFAGNWEWDETKGGEAGQPVPVRMPVVRYRNEEGVGEFERHTDILDRIDNVTVQGMVIVTLQAFKQRAIHVAPEDMPERDKNGDLIDYSEMFLADPGALWKLPATAKLWESGVVDVTPIMNMRAKEIQTLSAVTFTPLSMFTPDAVNQSATGASLVREGLTSKIEDKQGRLGESHVQTMALLGRIAGLEAVQDPASVRIRWAPAERYSLAEKADAGTKAKDAGMPWATRMRQVWQMEPEDIARMQTERLDEALLTAISTPAPAPAVAPVAPPAQQPEPSPAADAAEA